MNAKAWSRKQKQRRNHYTTKRKPRPMETSAEKFLLKNVAEPIDNQGELWYTNNVERESP